MRKESRIRWEWGWGETSWFLVPTVRVGRSWVRFTWLKFDVSVWWVKG